MEITIYIISFVTLTLLYGGHVIQVRSKIKKMRSEIEGLEKLHMSAKRLANDYRVLLDSQEYDTKVYRGVYIDAMQTNHKLRDQLKTVEARRAAAQKKLSAYKGMFPHVKLPNQISTIHKERNATVLRLIREGNRNAEDMYWACGWSRQGIKQSLIHLEKVGKIVKDGHGEYYRPEYGNKPQSEESTTSDSKMFKKCEVSGMEGREGFIIAVHRDSNDQVTTYSVRIPKFGDFRVSHYSVRFIETT